MGRILQQLLKDEFADKTQVAALIGNGQPMAPLLDCDVVIDFTLTPASCAFAKTLTDANRPQLPAWVIGTTGFSYDEKKLLEEAAKKTPTILAANYSTGVLALYSILKHAAPLLDKLGYKPVIVEAHHQHKKDAPSGTAVSMQRVISPAGPGNVQTHSIRAGEVIGDHAAHFYGKADEIVISHAAQDRTIFARGAIEAALWVAGKRGQGGGALLTGDAFFADRFGAK